MRLHVLGSSSLSPYGNMFWLSPGEMYFRHGFHPLLQGSGPKPVEYRRSGMGPNPVQTRKTQSDLCWDSWERQAWLLTPQEPEDKADWEQSQVGTHQGALKLT